MKRISNGASFCHDSQPLHSSRWIIGVRLHSELADGERSRQRRGTMELVVKALDGRRVHLTNLSPHITVAEIKQQLQVSLRSRASGLPAGIRAGRAQELTPPYRPDSVGVAAVTSAGCLVEG